jgi:transaldolase
MTFFVDTADTAEIRSLPASGLLDGLTTNPTFVAKTGKEFAHVIAEIFAIVQGLAGVPADGATTGQSIV